MSAIMSNFKDLILPPQLESAVAAMGYQTPTPIQAQAIPVALTNRDIIGCAQTGTGKTAAFCIPMIARLLKTPRRNSLILVPTRELAVQIEEVLVKLTKSCKEMETVLIIGGVAMSPQVKVLWKKPRIVVATPGRLLDHLRRGNISLSTTEVLVLDEADRMLDMGFAPQLNEILRFLPKSRQTMLFSATLPPDILKLAAKYLKDPVRVTVGPVSEPIELIKQSVVKTTGATKNNTLVDELNARKGSVLIFARTKKRTDRVAKFLSECGYKASRIHGDRSQKQRGDAIDGFRDGKFRILVATDIAARGIDIAHIAHVINYDLPMVPEDYIHRIGRTARAGAEGQALSLLTPEDSMQWRDISKLLAKKEAAKARTTI
ncbi:MAG: DEAD/DEAH box helicase [Deltaproteobacteria bacterium]|nr:DEAD/DEAH box helicase [Deltaproteobacteria bacterium]